MNAPIVSAGLISLLVLSNLASATALTATPAEMETAGAWVAAKFGEPAKRPAPAARLTVLANNDAVQPDARGSRPMRIVDKQYTRGLYCHAVSKVIVSLPGPGRGFIAIVGVDSNEQTGGGRGSVVFSVAAGGKELFRSGTLREGMPGVPVDVKLNGASELTLEVGEAGDGISCDQADWADARVTLVDGKEIWLGDLPIVDPRSGTPDGEPPFSFAYNGRASSELLKAWGPVRSTRQLDPQRTEHTLLYVDPETKLSLRCAAVEYHDFPTVEWTLHFKNPSTTATPIIENIQALDVQFKRGPAGEFVLHHHVGSPCQPNDYQPLETTLASKTVKQITTSGGRSTNSDLPYFNVEWPGSGLIAVVGWPGQWAAKFARDDKEGLRIRAGQELTRFKLLPGEEVRSPLIVLKFYKGDRIRSQNLWRRWMIAHNLPRPGGQLPPIQMAACSSHQYGEMIHADRDSQIMFVSRYLEERFKLDYWWMDAGWYWNKTGWPNVGTWEVDTDRFPGGLRPICDFAHGKGVKTIVWFEPERVTPGTWLYEKHPEWLLGKDGEQKLLNLGNAQARQWLTGHVDKLITEQGIDLYRQDCNTDMLHLWRANDAADRQGITEIGHVTGYLAYWDELRRRHPNMLIDSCASGGRRNDLETLRRAVPLLRSDYIIEPVGNQCHTYGIASWIPYFGTGSGAIDPYMLRSVLCPHFTACFDMRRKDLDFDLARRILDQWRQFAPCYLGDYYPLTSYSLANDVWMAWQFNRPETRDGVVQVFRRADSIYESARLRMHGLDAEAEYLVNDVDVDKPTVVSGQQLMEKGLPVKMPDRPAAVVITYRRQ